MTPIAPKHSLQQLDSAYVRGHTQAFEERFAALEQDHFSDLLRSCPGLKEFLPRALGFLERRPECAIYVAHFLMGKIDHLPAGLAAPSPEIDRKAIREGVLEGLLRTNRHFFSNSEKWDKTLLKLRALNAHIQTPALQNAYASDWRADKRFVLCMQNDDKEARAIVRSAVSRYAIPESNVFSVNFREDDVIERQRPPLGAELTRTSLGGITLADRLDIVSHGSKDTVSGLSPDNLASLLVASGLEKVGVLSLNTCNTGRGDYLDKLKVALAANHILVGYLCAYKGYFTGAKTLPYKVLFPHLIGSSNIVWLGENALVSRAASQQKVIKGNVHVVFPGSQFNLPEPSKTQARPWFR